MKVIIVFVLVLLCSVVRAQSDSAAVRLLDDPGIPTDDIDYVYDYLENTPTQYDSSTKTHLRSRLLEDRGAIVSNNPFNGSPAALRNRLWLNSARFILAASEEKKAWEPNYTDRINGYLSIRSPVSIASSIALNQAAIGGYSMGFGSGLLFGDIGKVNRREHASELPLERGIRGSLSGDPFSAYFGGAATLGVSDHIALTGFYSSSKLDARVSGDSIVTLYEFADHRTDAELAMMNRATLTVEGARIAAYNSDSSAFVISGGISAYHAAYDHYYNGTQSNPFFGKTFDAASADAILFTDRLRVQSELALTSNDTMRRVMYVLQAAYHPSEIVGIAAGYRHIPFGIVSPFGRVFGKQIATLTDQDGYYLGVDAILFPKLLRASAYADLSSEILPISDEFARQKYDYGIALHSISRAWNADLTVRNQRGESTVSTDDSIVAAFSTQTLKTTTTRLDIRDTIGAQLIVSAQLQNVRSSNDSAHSEGGWFAGVGGKYSSLRKSMVAMFDAGRFSTPSYRSAIWMFEQPVQGSGRFLALYGNGYYLKIRMLIDVGRTANISIGASEVLYDSARMIGSGLTAGIASSSGEAAVQLDLLF